MASTVVTLKFQGSSVPREYHLLRLDYRSGDTDSASVLNTGCVELMQTRFFKTMLRSETEGVPAQLCMLTGFFKVSGLGLVQVDFPCWPFGTSIFLRETLSFPRAMFNPAFYIGFPSLSCLLKLGHRWFPYPILQ